ncbi:MAG: hypothetical protein M1822_004175 [Bathelium mastoideum]|nr:MAG: hypothetical protein M1822_004175 [Bathelium mastoideum]
MSEKAIIKVSLDLNIHAFGAALQHHFVVGLTKLVISESSINAAMKTRHEKIKDHMIRVHKKPKYMEVKCSSLSCSSGTHGGMYFDSDSDRQKHFELHHSHDTEGLRYDEAANGSLLPSQDIDENQALPSNHKKRTLDSNIEIVAKREKVMATPMQSSSLSYCRLHTTEHEITLIESIKIGDMCNFLGHPELRSINKELEKCNVKIIFTRSTGAIKIRGTLQEDVLNSAKARLKPLNSFPGSREGDTVPKLHPSATLDLCFKQRKEADNPIEILSIRRSEDIDAVTTWERFISPSLSGILQNAGVRYPYTATFVRQKQKDTLVGPAPVIRFQSSGQTAFQRQKIQEKIKEICLQHRRPPLPVHFYNATMVTLVGDSFQDDPPDDMGIPLQSRYYSQPGMSASIGLSRCNHMFATLGGYVRVGGRLYMLSVWHLIKDADACIQCRNIDTADNRVDSPAPIHVMALKRTLDENIRHSNKQFEDLLTDREDDVDISEWLDTVPKDQLEFRTHWNRWRNELDKGGADFRLGQLEQSSGGLTLHPPSYSRKNDLVIKQHCFDWAIFQVEGPRLGKNRYRYPLGKEVELNCQHFEEEARNPEGIGQFCESSREFRLGEAVYYAGSSKNNYIEGKIHEFPILCRDSQDKEYHEWGIIPDERMSADYFKGDSGALVVAKSDNHILGLLWAYSGDFLLFTPINEVFKQISMSMGNVHVEIARSDRSRALPPTVTTLSGRLAHVFYEKKCGSMEYSKRKQRQYFRLSDKIPPGHGAATATRISADIRSRSPSPVPSLVSSNASLSVSCTSAPSSPGMGSLDSDSETYDLEDPPKDVTIEALPFDLLTSPSSDRKDFPSQLMGGSVKVEA